MELTKAKVKEIGNKAEAILQEYFKDQGITVKRGNGTYTDLSFSMKIEFGVTNEEGHDRFAQEFLDHGYLWKLPKEMLGAEIILDRQQFTIIGLNTKKRKNSVLIKRVNDGEKRFTTSPENALIAYNNS